MKLKQIEVGKDYAIGSPSTTYGQWCRVRGRIVQVGVRGVVNGSWNSYLSEKANYVQFEPVKDGKATGSSGLYEARLNPDKWECWGRGSTFRDPGPYRTVHLALATHVLMSWNEYLEKLAEHQKAKKEGDAAARLHKERAAHIRDRFKELGFSCGGWKDHEFEFDTDDVERMVDVLEAVAKISGEWKAGRMNGGSAAKRILLILEQKEVKVCGS